MLFLYTFKTIEGTQYKYSLVEIPNNESSLFLHINIDETGNNGIESGLVYIVSNYTLNAIFVDFNKGIPSYYGSWDNPLYFWQWYNERYDD